MGAFWHPVRDLFPCHWAVLRPGTPLSPHGSLTRRRQRRLGRGGGAAKTASIQTFVRSKRTGGRLDPSTDPVSSGSSFPNPRRRAKVVVHLSWQLGPLHSVSDGGEAAAKNSSPSPQPHPLFAGETVHRAEAQGLADATPTAQSPKAHRLRGRSAASLSRKITAHRFLQERATQPKRELHKAQAI